MATGKRRWSPRARQRKRAFVFPIRFLYADTRQVLGAHMIGPHAALLLQPLVNAMRFGETVDQLAHGTFYIHPALTEVVEQAVLEIAPPAVP
jgi:pyruvate/2-oxoglutarate dehydrogenase complex dihydrolipoamide dehydrogenase (E3) component